MENRGARAPVKRSISDTAAHSCQPMHRVILAAVLCLWIPSVGTAQGRQGPAPVTAKAAAPIDLTGYWSAVLTEDWHTRMFTAAKGDCGGGAPGEVAQVGASRLGVGANPARDGNIP